MTGCVFVAIIIFYLFIFTETFLLNPHQIASSDLSIIAYFMYTLPSIVFILLKLYSIKTNSSVSLFSLFRSKKIIDIELIILLMIILYPLPFQYFKGIQIYLAYLFKYLK